MRKERLFEPHRRVGMTDGFTRGVGFYAEGQISRLAPVAVRLHVSTGFARGKTSRRSTVANEDKDVSTELSEVNDVVSRFDSQGGLSQSWTCFHVESYDFGSSPHRSFRALMARPPLIRSNQ